MFYFLFVWGVLVLTSKNKKFYWVGCEVKMMRKNEKSNCNNLMINMLVYLKSLLMLWFICAILISRLVLKILKEGYY